MTQANDRSILMLPKLRDNRVRRGTAGMWNRQDPNAFNAVARSIDVIVSSDVANVNSIPSMWAHPLSLESILPSNEYHDRIRKPLINQWRGMLTAIALAPDFEEFGKLTAQPLDLTDARYKNNKFIQSLFRLVPNTENCLFDLPRGLNPWLKGYIFRWNNKSIGMTSPSTIVCPSEDGDWTGLPWFIEGAVESPEEYLTPDQKSRLSRWLVHLRKKLAEQKMGLCESISSLINSFIDDLGGDRELGINPATDLISAELYFGVELNFGIYTVINQPLRDPRGDTLKDVFFDELYFLRRPDAFPNAALPESVKNLSFGGSPISLILPIQPSFFNRADTSSLLNTLKVDRLRAGTALKLSISVDGHHLEQEYELKNENAISGLPIAEIWPNFVHPQWKVYYAYSSLDIDDTRLSFEFPNIQNPAENIHKYGVANRSRLAKLTSFPSHVICSCEDKVVGSIPLQVPTPIQTSGLEWTVGVDFGTSFTNAYRKQGDSDEKISFENLHYQVSAFDQDERLTILTDDFIPPKQLLPIASLLTVKGARNQVSHNSDREAEIMFDSRIYALQAPRKVEDGKDFLIGNLKWDNAKNQEPMRLFIEQLALQISAQAVRSGVSQINWALSYPTAFSRRDKNSYVNIWNTCSEKLCQFTGLTYGELSSAKGSKTIRSESLAVAHYFASKKGKSLLNAACIDIGGGTSDISIWEEKGNQIIPIYQCSVQLAGKHLFSNIVKRYPQFLTDIKLANNDTFIKLQGEPALFGSAIDALAKEASEDWLRNQRRKLQDHESLYGYLQILAIGVAGLHYYVGLVLQVLHDNGRYQAGEPTDIYFGGNGCRLLNWLSDTGKFEGDEIGDLFQEMVVYASKLKSGSEANAAVSDKPKEEAACGLVVGKKKLGDPTNTEEELVAGEPCKIGSHKFEWNSFITFDPEVVESIDEFQVVRKAEELVNLPQFLYWYHKRLRAKRDIAIPAIKGYSLGDPRKTDQENLDTTIQDNIKLWDKVVKKLRDSLVLEDGATTESIRLEPPFILALKALIEVLAEGWAN